MRVRYRYLPIDLAAVGMVLGAPVQVSGANGVVRFSLPAGHVLVEDSLRQLQAHRGEYVFIEEPDARTDETVSEDAAAAVRRTLEIFAGADLSDPLMAAFFDQVLAYRSA